MTIPKLFLYIAFVCLAACGGGGGGGRGGGSSSSSSSSSGGADTTAPTLQLIFPPLGQTFLAAGAGFGNPDVIFLRGTADDNVGIMEILSNIDPVFLSTDPPNWYGTVPLEPGLNSLSIRASDVAGNSSTAAEVSLINDGAFLFHMHSLMFDAAGDRLLLVDGALKSITQLDLSNNYRSEISFETPIDLGFSVYESSGNYIYFHVQSEGLLKRLDLDNGSVVTISDLTNNGGAGSGPGTAGISGMIYNGDKIFFKNTGGTILSVNPSSGARAIVASSTVGGGDDFLDLMAIAWDSDNTRLLALDQAVGGELYAINVSNGDRTLLSKGDGTLGTGPDFRLAGSSALAYDPAEDRALFVAFSDSTERYALFSVDLSGGPNNGNRTIISDNVERGLGTKITGGGTMPLVVDSANQKAYLAIAGLYTPMEIDLNTGSRRLLSSVVGGGVYRLTDPRRGRFDSEGGRLLIAAGIQQALFAVDVSNGDKTIVSGSGAGGGPAFEEPVAVDINAAGTTAYVLDPEKDAIFAVNLGSGTRGTIGFGTVSSAVDMVFDEDNGRFLVADFGENALLEVTLAGGASVLLSDLAADPDPDNGQGPVAIEIDRATNRAFIVVNDFVSTGVASGVVRSKIVELNLDDDSTQELLGLDDGIACDDLAMGPDGNTLYGMSTQGMVYQIDADSGEVLMPDSVFHHIFRFHQMSAIETGVQDKTVYMFDALSGAVMLMEIDSSGSGDSFGFEYSGVIVSQ